MMNTHNVKNGAMHIAIENHIIHSTINITLGLLDPRLSLNSRNQSIDPGLLKLLLLSHNSLITKSAVVS